MTAQSVGLRTVDYVQSHTATSTMKAKTSAACDAAKENAFLRDLCHEMGTTQKVVQMNAHESKVHPDRVMGEATHPIPRGQCKCRMFGLQPPVECVAEESPHGKAIQPSK